MLSGAKSLVLAIVKKIKRSGIQQKFIPNSDPGSREKKPKDPGSATLESMCLTLYQLRRRIHCTGTVRSAVISAMIN
jgi:hypothetical protein